MKSHVIATLQQVLSYGLDEAQCAGVDLLAKNIGAEHKVIRSEDVNEKVGYLCGFRGFYKSGETDEVLEGKQCLIFSGIQRKNIQKLLSSLKLNGLNIPLKAMVTPTNQSWALKDLICELEKEHEVMTKGQA